jgi:hypothetical protein
MTSVFRRSFFAGGSWGRRGAEIFEPDGCERVPPLREALLIGTLRTIFMGGRAPDKWPGRVLPIDVYEVS